MREAGARVVAPRLWARVRGPLGAGPATTRARRRRTRSIRRPSIAGFRSVVAWCVGAPHAVLSRRRGLRRLAGAIPPHPAAILPGVVAPGSARRSAPSGRLLLRRDAEANEKMEEMLDKDPAVESYVSYVGTGSPASTCRSISSCSSRTSRNSSCSPRATPNANTCVRASCSSSTTISGSARARVATRERTARWFPRSVSRFRATNIPRCGIAGQVADVMRANPSTASVQFDWDEPSKVIRLRLDQNKARAAGLSSQELAAFVNNSLSGLNVTYFRERDKLIEVLLRGPSEERARLSFLKDLAIPTKAAAQCRSRRSPTSSTGSRKASSGGATGCRRSPCVPTCVGDAQGPDVTARSIPELDRSVPNLPLGYRIEIGGAIEDSAKGQKSIAAGVPVLIITVLTLLMIQLQSLKRTADGGAHGAARTDRRDRRAARCLASPSALSRCWERSRCPASSCATR